MDNSLQELYQELHRRFEYREGQLWSRLFKNKTTPIGSPNKDGYLVVNVETTSIKRRPMLVHRLIYFMHHGTLPDIVDHTNRDRVDNRIENLREATRSQNMHNSDKRARNTSGFKGVFFHTRLQRWHARIMIDRKEKHLGSFHTAEEASAAYQEASRQLLGEFSAD